MSYRSLKGTEDDEGLVINRKRYDKGGSSRTKGYLGLIATVAVLFNVATLVSFVFNKSSGQVECNHINTKAVQDTETFLQGMGQITTKAIDRTVQQSDDGWKGSAATSNTAMRGRNPMTTMAPGTGAAAQPEPKESSPTSAWDATVKFVVEEDERTGQSDRERSCSLEYGMDMIHKWRNSKLDLCTSVHDSQLTCYRRSPFDVPRLLCVAKNVAVRAYEPYLTYQSPFLNQSTEMKTKRGILAAKCDPTVYSWIPQEQWVSTVKAFMQNLEASEDQRLGCKQYVNHTVYWLERYDATNFYHFSEDIITAFETMLLLGEDPEKAELIAYDGKTKGYQLWDVYGLMFGHGGRWIRDKPYPPGTCFRKSIFNMHGGISLLSQRPGVGTNTVCSSPLLRGLRHFLEKRLQFSALNENRIRRVTWVSRQHFGGRHIERVIPNEAEILQFVREQLPEGWEVVTFRPETMTNFRAQVALIRETDILVGVHGAALMYALLMPSWGHVIEVFYGDRSPDNRHYHNICKWLGLTYHSPGYMGIQNEKIDAHSVWTQINAAIREISRAH